MHKDDIFLRTPFERGGFSFNGQVAHVFDDMVSRSVPGYFTIQDWISKLVQAYLKPGFTVLDLGCSTGTTLLGLQSFFTGISVQWIGLDKSQDMIQKAQEKQLSMNISGSIQWQVHDLVNPLPINSMDLVICNLILQFLPLKNRLDVLKDIRKKLNKNGVMIWIEKIKPAHAHLESLWTQIYYQYKHEQGYAWTEIESKHKALEGVLVPLTELENRALLAQAGFTQVEPFFQWGPFWGVLVS